MNTKYALIEWVNYSEDDLYDVKPLASLVNVLGQYKLNGVYRIKEGDGRYYSAKLLKIGIKYLVHNVLFSIFFRLKSFVRH